MSVLEVITGVFTNHLHHERGDIVRLDVLDLQNLFAVFLCHRPHLCETGHYFRVEQAGGTNKGGSNRSAVKGLSLNGLSGTWYFTHCFPGPVLLQSIQVFSVSATFSYTSSIMLCCCTPGRSDRTNKNKSLLIQSNLKIGKYMFTYLVCRQMHPVSVCK